MNIAKSILIICIYLMVSVYVLSLLPGEPRDSTDPANGRSGLRLMIDNATGCEYLSAGFFGGITPRMDSDYMHMGCTGLQESESQ